MMNSNGIEISVRDRTADRYFITDDDGVEQETDEAGFIAMERRCGFRPKPGCGPFATANFSSGKRSGRIEMAKTDQE